MSQGTTNRLLSVAVASALLTIGAGTALAQEAPKYGGTLEVATVYTAIPALSFNPADWNWKLNHDTGAVYEQLFASDISKHAKSHGGTYDFVADAWIQPESMRGELAQTWAWEDPMTMVIKLRKGIMFPAKEGVMKARELVADDVVFSYEQLLNAKKAQKGYFNHLDSVSARDAHTVVFKFKEYNAEWDYRFGYGYYSVIMPKEVAAAGGGDWKNMNGTGPFFLTDYKKGNSSTYSKNPKYWDSETIKGKKYKLPYVDQVIYRNLTDESTRYAALRTGKIDLLEVVRWSAVQELKKNAPDLKWKQTISMTGQYVALRNDTKPFDDVRVRRALNLAVNQKEITDSFYGGNAELFAYPQHPNYTGYYEPLSAMPDSVKELFDYNPEKAKQLLVEAGYPDGFTFKVQVNARNSDQLDLLPLIGSYLEKVGVKIEIEPLEYPAFLGAMLRKKVAPGYFMSNGATNPTTAIRKQFVTKETWNASQFSDPKVDQMVTDFYLERDDAKRQAMVREATRYVLDQAPYIFLPTPHHIVAWWPWVKNYEGELRAGAVRPWPIYSRIWIDQAMKKKMGY